MFCFCTLAVPLGSIPSSLYCQGSQQTCFAHGLLEWKYYIATYVAQSWGFLLWSSSEQGWAGAAAWN